MPTTLLQPPLPRYGPPITVEQNDVTLIVRVEAPGFLRSPPAWRLLAMSFISIATALTPPVVFIIVEDWSWSIDNWYWSKNLSLLLGILCTFTLLFGLFWLVSLQSSITAAWCRTQLLFNREALTIEMSYPSAWLYTIMRWFYQGAHQVEIDHPNRWSCKVSASDYQSTIVDVVIDKILAYELVIVLHGNRPLYTLQVACGRTLEELQWLAGVIRHYFEDNGDSKDGDSTIPEGVKTIINIFQLFR